MQDAAVQQSLTLPNGAATTTSSGIDLGAGQHKGNVELRFDAPALSLTLLPDTQTITYTLEFSNASNFGTIGRTVSLGVQTGATGTDPCAAIVNRRYRPANNDFRYVRAKAVKTGAANASSAAATLVIDAA